MNSHQIQPPIKLDDDAYLRIMEIDQAHSSSRWTLTTFFMSVSFAILGFSFQDKIGLSASFAIRISGLLIYWFAYFMFKRFLDYNKVLRTHTWPELSSHIPALPPGGPLRLSEQVG